VSAQPREHLAAMLWPESSPERSYANLRNTLNHLQTILRQARSRVSSPYLSITYQALGINIKVNIDFDLYTGARATDLARADRSSRTPPESAASLPVLHLAAACQCGDFLAGFSWGMHPTSMIGSESSA
jgi:hypothetical protein